ncbi:MAG: FAD:protein transferase [Thermoleophilaceae bacterium]|nr:FAD:protein transferase [Thermoleophilaceae bacterium]
MTQTEAFAEVPVFGGVVTLAASPDDGAARAAVRAAAHLMKRMHATLSRFDPYSELSRLNRSADTAIAISPLMADAVRAALTAAEASGGLVDPALEPRMHEVGYGASRVGAAPVDLRSALRDAPKRRPAACGDPLWMSVSVEGGVLRRPLGIRLDLGGVAKGLAADLAAGFFDDCAGFVVDVAGDLVFAGVDPEARPVFIEHPLEGERPLRLALSHGCVATSGLSRRIWRMRGEPQHHIIDPQTGRPAWTGVIQASALASTCTQAEMLAKQALLAGPETGAALLRAHGGALVLDDGSITVVGPLEVLT